MNADRQRLLTRVERRLWGHANLRVKMAARKAPASTKVKG